MWTQRSPQRRSGQMPLGYREERDVSIDSYCADNAPGAHTMPSRTPSKE
jgi:hypothetical protein